MAVTQIDNTNVKRNLEKLFKPGEFDKFSALLLKYDAIVAGGSILSSFHNRLVNDLDIYVKISNAANFYAELQQISLDNNYNYFLQGHITSPYDKSFLARNNILYRKETRLIGNSVAVNRFPTITKIDLMIANVDDITDVPKNFDLTFCMIWYDGKDVFAIHPDDVTNKKGKLMPDYTKALLQGNTFTLNRMRKYTKRGYIIKYSSIDIGSVEYEIKTKNPISAEEWVTIKLLQYLIEDTFYNNYTNSRGLTLENKSLLSFLIHQ